MSRDVGEGVRLSVSISRLMSEVEIKATEIQGPSCLSASEVLCRAPVLQITVIGDDVE
jgi:hypothetical protein